MLMRLNAKLFLLCLFCAAFTVTLIFWTRCNVPILQPIATDLKDISDASSRFWDIRCNINNDYSVNCLRTPDDVYIPFSFIHKYFEIYGRVGQSGGKEVFEWKHSTSHVYHPQGKYDPRGPFMHFEKFNVEQRDRVKCVSAKEGVPISTQWQSYGYFYPTQIAQFGLSHYSKNLTNAKRRYKTLEDGGSIAGDWTLPEGATISRDAEKGVLTFNTGPGNVISLTAEHTDLMLSVNVKLEPNSSVTAVVRNGDAESLYRLHYIGSELNITGTRDGHIYHGIGLQPGWRRLTRDLAIDLQKGLSATTSGQKSEGAAAKGQKVQRSRVRLLAVELRGSGSLDNLTIANSEHEALFYAAADWFVERQDPATGGWSNTVTWVKPGFGLLKSGWLSAMGQGQAISVLARAFYRSGKSEYLQAAFAGLRPFRVPSWQGGVLATFLGKYVWYEEYPTAPASFVLNGFIYALLGLYDLSQLAPDNRSRAEPEALFRQGVDSLKGMLSLYDTGSGSCYDLRHFTLATAPNLARWDYHSTHVNQLLLLATVDADPLFPRVAERWIGYMKGNKAGHN